MRKTKFFETQNRRTHGMKRLRELEQENGLLKLLYVDLLQKSVAMKEGAGKSAYAWGMGGSMGIDSYR